GKPKVVTLHAAYEPAHLLTKPLGKARLRLYRHIIDRFVSISDDIRELLRSAHIPAENILDIPNGIDRKRFQPASDGDRQELRARLRLPSSELVILFVGRLHPIKQVDVLLHALSAVPDGRLLILGDGDERPRLERLVGEL